MFLNLFLIFKLSTVCIILSMYIVFLYTNLGGDYFICKRSSFFRVQTTRSGGVSGAAEEQVRWIQCQGGLSVLGRAPSTRPRGHESTQTGRYGQYSLLLSRSR